MTGPPRSGAITFLFTDIEGSTLPSSASGRPGAPRCRDRLARGGGTSAPPRAARRVAIPATGSEVGARDRTPPRPGD